MVSVDSFEQNPHTLKSQIAVDGNTGRIVDTFECVPGPTADIRL